MMKKVIFVCLLSLTTCLSRPDGTPGTPQAQPSANVVPGAQTPAPAPAIDTHTQNAQPSQNTTLAPPATTAANITEAPATAATTASTATPPPHTDATTKKTGEDAVTPKVKNETTTVAPKKGDANNVPAGNSTVPEDKNKKNETSVPSASTVNPPKAIEAAGRSFDGPSFLGGMILTLGLLAIGFMGFKYYRNQTERNYHTL